MFSVGIGRYTPEEQVSICRAFQVATFAHFHQTRKTTLQPYVLHVLQVAIGATQIWIPAYGVVAALLHDVLEDTSHSRNELLIEFGDQTLKVIDALTKPEQDPGQVQFTQQIATAAQEDILVAVIKLLDILANTTDLVGLEPDAQKRYLAKAQEYLNLWQNNGEVPPVLIAAVRKQLLAAR
jgi:(p)ppGpp synthase/HD superfamily hydrolase